MAKEIAFLNQVCHFEAKICISFLQIPSLGRNILLVLIRMWKEILLHAPYCVVYLNTLQGSSYFSLEIDDVHSLH